MPITLSMCTIAWRADRRSYTGPNLARPLPEVLATIREAGFAGAELWGPHVAACGASRVREQLERLGLSAPMLSDYYNFTRSAESAAASLAHARTVLVMARELRSGAIRIFTGNHRSADASDEQWHRCADCLRMLCDEAAQDGIVLAAEMHDWNLMDTPDGAERLLELVARPNFRLIFHPSLFATGVLAVWSRLRAHIHHVHATNGDAGLAAGPVDYPALVARLRSDGWHGALSVEWFGDDPEGVARREAAYLRGLLMA